MPVLGEIQGSVVPVKIWAPLEEVESGALQQLRNTASLPWVRHVRAMPDVHLGFGATVGSVIAMKEALSPSAVGVDIGCGMGAIKTTLRAEDLPDNLGALRSAIEAAIPVGFNSHEAQIQPKGYFHLQGRMQSLWDAFPKLHEKVQDREGRARKQLGTLGGGNHFIELCVDTEGWVWMMLHSGSRNIGKELAEVHIKIAKTLEHNAKLPDPELAVFLEHTPEMDAYLRDLYWAQYYALLNREVMANQSDLVEVVAVLRAVLCVKG